MRITTKGRYALRAMTNLAITANGKPKAIKTIAAEEDISPEFLEQIFFKLKKAGIIDSVRGPGGGFMISAKPETISVRDIFLAVDEGLDITPCTACNEKDLVDCGKMDSCLVHDIWKEASDHINTFFEKINLQSIMDSAKNKDGKLNALLSGEQIKLS